MYKMTDKEYKDKMKRCNENDALLAEKEEYIKDCKLWDNNAYGCLRSEGKYEEMWNEHVTEECVSHVTIAPIKHGIYSHDADGNPIEQPNYTKPKHYSVNWIFEPIKVISAWKLNFNLGNVLKYIFRGGKKNNEDIIKDLKKAREYLDREIKELENPIEGFSNSSAYTDWLAEQTKEKD